MRFMLLSRVSLTVAALLASLTVSKTGLAEASGNNPEFLRQDPGQRAEASLLVRLDLSTGSHEVVRALPSAPEATLNTSSRLAANGPFVLVVTDDSQPKLLPVLLGSMDSKLDVLVPFSFSWENADLRLINVTGNDGRLLPPITITGQEIASFIANARAADAPGRTPLIGRLFCFQIPDPTGAGLTCQTCTSCTTILGLEMCSRWTQACN